jgi:hypothetical protein
MGGRMRCSHLPHDNRGPRPVQSAPTRHGGRPCAFWPRSSRPPNSPASAPEVARNSPGAEAPARTLKAAVQWHMGRGGLAQDVSVNAGGTAQAILVTVPQARRMTPGHTPRNSS